MAMAYECRAMVGCQVETSQTTTALLGPGHSLHRTGPIIGRSVNGLQRPVGVLTWASCSVDAVPGHHRVSRRRLHNTCANSLRCVWSGELGPSWAQSGCEGLSPPSSIQHRDAPLLACSTDCEGQKCLWIYVDLLIA